MVIPPTIWRQVRKMAHWSSLFMVGPSCQLAGDISFPRWLVWGSKRRQAEEVLEAGYALRAFTVNSARRASKLYGWGVQSLFTDYPERLLGT